MAITRRLARPLLAGIFVTGGLDALQHPETKAGKASTVTEPLADAGLPADTETLVRVNGAVQVAAGALLAMGKLPRLAAVALAGSLVPTTVAGHSFWDEQDPKARATQRIHFLKNLSVLGGLILAATDTEGRPSLSWRAKQAGSHVAERLPLPHAA